MKLDSPTLSPPLQVRIELNEERDNRARMQHTIAKLRNIIVAQANGQDAQGDPAAARFNPYIAAWYRKTNADQEFQQYPPKVGLPIMPLGVHTSATSAPLPVSYKWPLRLPPTAPCPGYWGGIRTPTHPSEHQCSGGLGQPLLHWVLGPATICPSEQPILHEGCGETSHHQCIPSTRSSTYLTALADLTCVPQQGLGSRNSLFLLDGPDSPL